jgi:hypothetical protein
MKLAKSYDSYVNHALERQISGGLQKLFIKLHEMRREVKRRHAGPLLAIVCVGAMVVGWNLG